VLTLPRRYDRLDNTPAMHYSGVVSRYTVAWESFTGMRREYFADFDAAMARFAQLHNHGLRPFFYDSEA
jgi:hypothetical protein